jgi:hypothetical protein
MPHEEIGAALKVAVNHCPYVSNIHRLIRTNTPSV